MILIGKQQLEIDLLKKRGFLGEPWKLVEPDFKGENGTKLTVLEQCKILEISKAAYYDNLRKEEERQRKKAKNLKNKRGQT